jgi:hypothetical protein
MLDKALYPSARQDKHTHTYRSNSSQELPLRNKALSDWDTYQVQQKDGVWLSRTCSSKGWVALEFPPFRPDERLLENIIPGYYKDGFIYVTSRYNLRRELRCTPAH